MALLSGTNKIFVLDTNVILHDHNCISSFQEHNVVIPITVLEEIDKFKKGNETINFNAREFSRKLDAMGGDKLLSDGIPLPSGGTLIVETNVKRDALLGDVFWEDKPDHRIISLAFNLAKEYGSPGDPGLQGHQHPHEGQEHRGQGGGLRDGKDLQHG